MKYSILIADNDADFVRICAEFFESHGYRVYTASTPAEAKHILTTTRLHLAILDRRLTDDDPRDRSGETLAREIARPIVILIATKWDLDGWDVAETMEVGEDRWPAAMAYISKLERLPKILQIVEQKLAAFVSINWKLKIRGRSLTFLSGQIMADNSDTPAFDLAGDLEDLFRILFREWSQITVCRVLEEHEGQAVLHVSAFRERGPTGQFVVVCGQKQQVLAAAAAYDRYVPSGTGYVTRVEFAQRFAFAGAVYALSGGDLEQLTTLPEYYRSQPAERINTVLQALYTTILAPWYQQQRELVHDNAVIEHYLQWLGLRVTDLMPANLERRVRSICQSVVGPALLDYDNHGIKVHLPDGSSVIYANPACGLNLEQLANGLSATCGVVYGAVHPDTILIDGQHGQPWLVDFSQIVERAPVLCDFVQLESGVKFNLFDGIDLRDRHAIEQRLAYAERLDTHFEIQNQSVSVQKALQIITTIRSLAVDAAGERDSRAYRVGLLFYAIRYLLSYDPDVRYERRSLQHYAHALLSAAMLYHDLIGVTEIRKGLFIDERKSVLVNGRLVKVTPQDFRMLEYLYQHAGLLCTYIDIIRNVYPADYKQLEIGKGQGESLPELDEQEIVERERGRVEATIFRLRKAIEPDQKTRQYLITDRRRGIILYRNNDEHHEPTAHHP